MTSEPLNTELYFDKEDFQWPIIYCDEYNVRFMGFEKLHPFDSCKWDTIVRHLENAKFIDKTQLVKPNEPTKNDLLVIHTRKYLRSLKCSLNVAKITEIPPLCFVPNYFVEKWYLKPMRYQVGGSILAGKLALDCGWAINIGGGFHHCSAEKGGGFCSYADISLLIKYLFSYYPSVVKAVMIVDLDAHQGNGHERDFMDDPDVYILDVYNKEIYPQDHSAKKAIRKNVPLSCYTADAEYLLKLRKCLQSALNEFNPNLVVYNAGTDILKGDSLGKLSISPEGIITRDELVFKTIRSKNIPIVMLTSGGYLKETAKVIANSILNLHKNNLINGPPTFRNDIF